MQDQWATVGPPLSLTSPRQVASSSGSLRCGISIPAMTARVNNGGYQSPRVRSASPQSTDLVSADRFARVVPKADIAHPLGASETIVVFSSTGAAGGAEIPLVSSKDALSGNCKLVCACQRPCLYLIRNALSVRSVKADLPSLSTVRG